MKFTLIVAVLLSLVMAFFAVQNSQHTQVTFMGWYFDAPLVIVLLLAFGIGATAAFLAMLPGSLRKSIEISKLKKISAEAMSKIESIEKQSLVYTAPQEKNPKNEQVI
jgi:lipopolysaccharide assembly protein A